MKLRIARKLGRTPLPRLASAYTLTQLSRAERRLWQAWRRTPTRSSVRPGTTAGLPSFLAAARVQRAQDMVRDGR